MAKWIEYTGSDEQFLEIVNYENNVLLEFKHGVKRFRSDFMPGDFINGGNLVRYLICEPHPYADIIKIWADTGCEVWIKPHKPYSFKISDYENNPYAKLLVNEAGVIIVTTKPDWNMNAEYSLTPFDDREE